MRDPVNKLPDDPAFLKEIITLDESEIERLREENRLLRQRLFGRKSEKKIEEGDPDQGLLFDIPEVDESEDVEDDAETQDVAAHERKKRGRKAISEDLPRVDIIHDIPEEDKVCGCGQEFKCIGEDVSERLVYVPAQIYVERHCRLKYACRACESTDDSGPTVKIAPLPPRLLPKTMATPSLLAQLVTAKFCDALPFYRQEKQFKRIGFDMNRTTMCNWAMKVADACKPLVEVLEGEIRSGPLINADETTVQVLKEVGRLPTTKSYMWVFRGGDPAKPVLRYLYAPTRAGKVAKEFLANYVGVVQTDGYKGYDFLDGVSEIQHVGCWAHARRRFADVIKVNGKTEGKGKSQAKRKGHANKVIRLLRDVYKFEKQLRANELSPEDFVTKRKQAVEPILKVLKANLEDLAPKTPPGGLLGKAISFTLNQWDRLIRYLDHAFMTPDNNLIENAIRPFVVGRKNWLFSGNEKGAQASAALYSLIETAKASGLEPFKYLQYIFEKLPFATSKKDYEALLPANLTAEILLTAEPKRAAV